jgi:hypothetical protein
MRKTLRKQRSRAAKGCRRRNRPTPGRALMLLASRITSAQMKETAMEKNESWFVVEHLVETPLVRA